MLSFISLILSPSAEAFESFSQRFLHSGNRDYYLPRTGDDAYLLKSSEADALRNRGETEIAAAGRVFRIWCTMIIPSVMAAAIIMAPLHLPSYYFTSLGLCFTVGVPLFTFLRVFWVQYKLENIIIQQFKLRTPLSRSFLPVPHTLNPAQNPIRILLATMLITVVITSIYAFSLPHKEQFVVRGYLGDSFTMIVISSLGLLLISRGVAYWARKQR
jgi:hypothetical protein